MPNTALFQAKIPCLSTSIICGHTATDLLIILQITWSLFTYLFSLQLLVQTLWMLLLSKCLKVSDCINQKMKCHKNLGVDIMKIKHHLICQSQLIGLLSTNCTFQNFTLHWFLKQWESYLKSLISHALPPETDTSLLMFILNEWKY